MSSASVVEPDLPSSSGLTQGAGAEPIPGYRLIAPLGTGGFGEVWKCVAPGGLHKAIKIVPAGGCVPADEPGLAGQEQRALQRIKDIRHPFLLSLERVESAAGALLIVMELADKNLQDHWVECRQARQAGIPREQLLTYLAEAAEVLDLMGLQYGLQHLDVKPSNLFLVCDHVKVGDFGLVQDLGGAATQGPGLPSAGITPLYAAPETFFGAPSAASDQYSLALTYCELLTGVRPFKGKTPRQLALQRTQEKHDLGALPPADRPIVARALSNAPGQRFPCCLEFVHALMLIETPGGEGPAGNSKRTSSRVIRLVRSSKDTHTDCSVSGTHPALLLPPVAAVSTSTSDRRHAAATPGWAQAVTDLLMLAAGSWRTHELPEARFRTKPGERLLHQCTTRLRLATVANRLERFVQQWGTSFSGADGATFSFQLFAPRTIWHRFLNRHPGLKIQVRLTEEEHPSSLTAMRFEIVPFGCDRNQADWLLLEFGPALLAGMRRELGALPDARREDRVVWQPTLQVRSVAGDNSLGDVYVGRGKDLCHNGIGLSLARKPLLPHLEIQLPTLAAAPPERALAKVVNVHLTPDGWYEVGAMFLPPAG